MGSLEGWTQLRKRTSELEDTSIEISIMKQQGEKKAGKKKRAEYTRTVRQLLILIMVNTRRSRKRKKQKVFEAIMIDNFSQIYIRYQTTDAGNSEHQEYKCLKHYT